MENLGKDMADFSKGFNLGKQQGQKRPWKRFDINDRSKLPELRVFFVGIWEYTTGSMGAEVIAIDEYQPGDISIYPAFGDLQHRTWPNFWCELPDPMEIA